MIVLSLSASPRRNLPILATTLFLGTATGLFAQGTKADYERAASLAARTRNTVFKASVRPNWIEGNDRFWYRNDLAGGAREHILVDAVRGERTLAFDHEALAKALTEALGEPIRADRLDLGRLTFASDGSTFTFTIRGRQFRGDRRTSAIEPLSGAAGAEAEESDSPRPPSSRLSRRTGAETEVTFVNRTAGRVALFWLDTEGNRQPYESIEPGRDLVRHTYAGHVWLVTDADGVELLLHEAGDRPERVVIDGKALAAQRGTAPQGPTRRPSRNAPSPDGRWVATIRNDNVILRDRESGEEYPLTNDGSAEDAYRPRFAWSPDSSKLVTIREIPAQEHPVTVVESSPRDQVQPKVQTFDYLKPGDRIAHPRPRLFDISTRKPIRIEEDLFPNPWSLGDVRWSRDSSHFTFLYNQRGHQVLRIVAVDAATGATCALVDERSQTFIDYSQKTFVRWLDETDELIWMSERSGWNHLYRIDARTGEVKNAITEGGWVVRRVDRVDPQNRQVWFRALGIRPGQDPYHVHYARVNLDGSGLTLLTEGDGTHTVEFSPDGRYLIDTYSRVDLPPITELRRSEDGSLVCRLETADVSALEAIGWRSPERFVAKGRDGLTDIYGIIHRPIHFDESAKYPVIEQIYAGPHGAHVPKAFAAYRGPQSLAELGFIVVQIDGMGTNWRSKAFHDVCWRNLKDAGFPDRIAWMRAAGARYPQMDLERVGIYGGSAGGQNALGGLLFHPEFYKVGAADCGCHDNRMDKIWWNEAWMGWPVGPHYEASSNVVNAHRLQGKILLTVGELDRNVDPASTMQVVNALICAGKDFELIVFPVPAMVRAEPLTATAAARISLSGTYWASSRGRGETP